MATIRAHFIGDIHISKRHIDITQEALNGCLKLAEKDKAVNFICVMGDIFDTGRNPQLDHRNMAIDFINALSRIKTTFVLIGNHDRMNNRDFMSDIHPFYGMKDIKDVLYFVNKPKIIRLHKKYNILFMPYVPPGRFQEAINLYLDENHKVDKLLSIKGIKDISLIMAHQEFKGVQYGPITSTKGDDWPDDYPMVVSGHIHELGTLKDNIFYTGSLYATSVSESNNKGVVTGTYYLDKEEFQYKICRVVTSTKKVMNIKAGDMLDVSNMISVDRDHTKYLVTGTREEIAKVKAQVKETGKNINWVSNIIIPNQIVTSTSFDDILREKLKQNNLEKMLEWILAE